MHITLETDYAIRIIVFLLQANKRIDARNISEGTEVTLRFALKILRKLVGAGLVNSFKGIKGGYEIAKKPEEISLYDIIEIIEGNCYLNRCLDDTIGCNRGCEGVCKVHKAFGSISEHMKNQLSDVTIDTLL